MKSSPPRSAEKKRKEKGRFPKEAALNLSAFAGVLTTAGNARLRRGQQALALHALARQLASATDGFGLLTGALFRGLLEVHVALHFTEAALALHLLLQGFERLVDVVVANENLNQVKLSFGRPPRPVRETGEQNKIVFRQPGSRMKAR
ncbi:hypothetical protein QE419_002005 [Brevundimonas vesicularis]|nr:hypothetical protein [Brevundimonas vesicularis]